MKLLLTNYQSPGDILMLTAAVRDLKTAYPEFQVNTKTTAIELWENNPYLDKTINIKTADKAIEMHYPLVHKSTEGSYHFIHGFRLFLEDTLKIKIPAQQFTVDIHLNEKEKTETPFPNLIDWKDKPVWIIDAGYKTDFTCKMWDIDRFQNVVNITKNEITWIQIGASNHIHKPLENTINLIGKTSHRQFIQLMYNTSGVLTPVSYPMHLATIPIKNYPERKRPCIVIAGAREPAVWEAYTTHTFIHNCGTLPCNFKGACWKSRVQTLNTNTKHNQKLCENPITLPSGQIIPKCLNMITTEQVVNHIKQANIYPIITNK